MNIKGRLEVLEDRADSAGNGKEKCSVMFFDDGTVQLEADKYGQRPPCGGDRADVRTCLNCKLVLPGKKFVISVKHTTLRLKEYRNDGLDWKRGCCYLTVWKDAKGGILSHDCEKGKALSDDLRECNDSECGRMCEHNRQEVTILAPDPDKAPAFYEEIRKDISSFGGRRNNEQ